MRLRRASDGPMAASHIARKATQHLDAGQQNQTVNAPKQLKWLREFFHRGETIEKLRNDYNKLHQEWSAAVIREDESDKAARMATLRYSELRAQVMQLRVAQSSNIKRAGWEVMCFIPEVCLTRMRDSEATTKLATTMATELVLLALAGINRVRDNGTVCALVFEPLNMNEPARAPSFVQALYDKEGTFKLSEKAWDKRTEEQRVRRAAGCGGFGV